MQEFINKFNKLASCVDNELANYCAQYPKDDTLFVACAYGLLAPGKRFRPVLALLAAELLEVSLERVLPFACALELIHSSTLIHDDLPSLDNDELRRGLPTCHKRFGEGVAVLAGDALISEAFSLISSTSRISPEVKVRLITLLSGTFSKICQGQVLDLEASKSTFNYDSDSRDILVAELIRRHSLKTGALIETSICGPLCYLSISNSSELYLGLEEVGRNIGLLFQVADDILDATSTTSKLGKTVGSDERQGTSTFVTVLGIEGAKEFASRLAEKAEEGLIQFGEPGRTLRKTAEFIINSLR